MQICNQITTRGALLRVHWNTQKRRFAKHATSPLAAGFIDAQKIRALSAIGGRLCADSHARKSGADYAYACRRYSRTYDGNICADALLIKCSYVSSISE